MKRMWLFGCLLGLVSTHEEIDHTFIDHDGTTFHDEFGRNHRRASQSTAQDNHSHDHNDGCGFQRPSPLDEKEDEARMATWRARRYENVFLRAKQQQYTIPVHVHIVQPNFFWGYQSDQDIKEALKYLNDAFARALAPFTFQHKTTSRTINREWGEHCGDQDVEVQFKRVLKKGGAESLNLYMCHSILDNDGRVLNGYSFAPFTGSDTFVKDGVVVSGRGSLQWSTLVHEVGHFLGLFHTFGTSCQETDGDKVSDTPVHTNRYASSISNCQVSKAIPWDSCPNAPGKDPLNNYMAYVKNSECRSSFTKGQVERMIGQYELYRKKPDQTKCLGFLQGCTKDSICCGSSQCVFFFFSNQYVCWF